jgi:hypothetical protein
MCISGVRECGNTVTNQVFFDTVQISPAMDQGEIQHRARQKQINLRFYPDGTVKNFSFSNLNLLRFCVMRVVFEDCCLLRFDAMYYGRLSTVWMLSPSSG